MSDAERTLAADNGGPDADMATLARGGRLNIFGFALRLVARIPFLFIAGRIYGAAALGRPWPAGPRRSGSSPRGWFGPVDPQVRPRLGDVVVAVHGMHAVMSSVDFPYETLLVGLHGSLTAVEMEIPILVS